MKITDTPWDALCPACGCDATGIIGQCVSCRHDLGNSLSSGAVPCSCDRCQQARARFPTGHNVTTLERIYHLLNNAIGHEENGDLQEWFPEREAKELLQELHPLAFPNPPSTLHPDEQFAQFVFAHFGGHWIRKGYERTQMAKLPDRISRRVDVLAREHRAACEHYRGVRTGVCVKCGSPDET